MSSTLQQGDRDHDGDSSEEVSGGAEGLSPEGYLLALVLIGAGYVAVRYVGDHYGWYWPWVIIPALVGVLLLWGHVSNAPRRQREAEKNRHLAAINREIDATGRVRELLQRRYEIERYYRRLEKEERARRRWRGKPISWPRRIVRWFSIALLIAIMIPLGIAFYGALFLLPSAAVFMGVYFLIGTWALVPAVLALPAGGWLVWWWVQRVPASTAQVAGLVGAAGSA